jgi:hypothetical protein
MPRQYAEFPNRADQGALAQTFSSGIPHTHGRCWIAAVVGLEGCIFLGEESVLF